MFRPALSNKTLRLPVVFNFIIMKVYQDRKKNCRLFIILIYISEYLHRKYVSSIYSLATGPANNRNLLLLATPVGLGPRGASIKPLRFQGCSYCPF